MRAVSRRRIVAVVVVVALGAGLALFFLPEFVAKRRVAAALTDPASARFGEVWREGTRFCGEVNSLDLKGKETGFRKFLVVGDRVYLEPPPPVVDRTTIESMAQSIRELQASTAFTESWSGSCYPD